MTLRGEPQEPTETSALMVGNTGFSVSGNHRARFGNSQKNSSRPRARDLTSRHAASHRLTLSGPTPCAETARPAGIKECLGGRLWPLLRFLIWR